MNLEYILLGTLALINIVSFSVVAYDKHLSRRGGNQDRVPEGNLFFMASAMGAVGVYLAMLTLRHKTRKWYFQLGIPFMIIQNLAVVLLAKEMINNLAIVH
jgi:uncharacterized membrane protein YsdA (DUF1294 family)